MTHQELTAHIIEQTLTDLKVPATVCKIVEGPTVTQYFLRPAPHIRVSRIALVVDDLAMNLSASSVRVLTPAPGQPYVGLEIPNETPDIVELSEILQSDEWNDAGYALPIPLGKSASGEICVADLAAAPHMLIAGATGSGKSVCLTTIISGLLMNPEFVALVLIDPKRVELTQFSGAMSLWGDEILSDNDRIEEELATILGVLETRYDRLNKAEFRNIDEHNAEHPTSRSGHMPRIVVVIDELADLMLTSGKTIENTIIRLAQLGRAAGIHLIVATQRPSSDIITGLIKANFPTRIAFAVSTRVDSRVILDQSGAETLVGRGDMLFRSSHSMQLERIQGAFTSNEMLDAVCSDSRNYSTIERWLYQLPFTDDLAATLFPRDSVRSLLRREKRENEQ
jgi:S-DNA-T family DNA segregation ATPase FtsK/SpoIIIE